MQRMLIIGGGNWNMKMGLTINSGKMEYLGTGH
jgi:hypothetical protein